MSEHSKNVERPACSAERLCLPGFGKDLTTYQEMIPPAKHRDPFKPRKPKKNAVFPSAVMDWHSNTITLSERAMLWIMDTLTDKPRWEEKVFDETIVGKWRAEIAQFEAAEREEEKKRMEASKDGGDVYIYPLSVPISDNMFDYCIRELRDKAEVFKKTGLVSVHDVAAMVVKSDTVVSEELRQAIREAVTPLENVPDDKKDWHPGSDGKVLDLVHPSLFPLVYGKTRVLPEHTLRVDDCLAAFGSGEVVPPQNPEKVTRRLLSAKFQWLPCEVDFKDGKASIASYINNLHPVKHRKLYTLLEQLMTTSLQAVAEVYERAETWDEQGTDRQRVSVEGVEFECGVPEICGRAGCVPGLAPKQIVRAAVATGDNKAGDEGDDKAGDEDGDDSDDDDDFDDENWQLKENARRLWFERTHPIIHPDPMEYKFVGSRFEGDVYPRWKNSRLQVIVKLANIHLTPEQPTYDGGSWHIEGQLNERICATALYYYDNDNITDSTLGFRTVVDSEIMCDDIFPTEGQSEHRNFLRTFGLKGVSHIDMENFGTELDMGAVKTSQGRLLVFPNVLQHRVSPFKLVDSTRPGHRKIVALFFVDPATPIISTAHVPPQSREWGALDGIDRRLPAELADEVYGDVGCPYSLSEAKKLRLELMDERKALQQDVDHALAGKMWNFCEH